MPIKEEILIYWADKLIDSKFWLDAVYDNMVNANAPITRSDAKGAIHICFACGSELGTERCHIVPKTDGGSDDAENLHLLCKECHIESEYLTGDVYWIWFKRKNPLNSGSHLRMNNLVTMYVELYQNGKFDLLPKYIFDIMRNNV